MYRSFFIAAKITKKFPKGLLVFLDTRFSDARFLEPVFLDAGFLDARAKTFLYLFIKHFKKETKEFS